MSTRLPDGITRDDILRAIERFDAGVAHAFAASTGYDLLHEGRRYPPKAIFGLAAERVVGRALQPKDFTGGEGSQCFQVLRWARFDIVTKRAWITYPDEIEGETYTEGAVKTVIVNRHERDPRARAACIAYHEPRCHVCELDFASRYGEIGIGFIHVHHLVPISELAGSREVDPIRDLRPVCPNCHAMLHRKTPPFSIEELRARLRPPRRARTHQGAS